MNYDTLLDRFLLCNRDLKSSTAIAEAYRTPPTADHKAVDLPMIYALPASFEVQGVDSGTDDDTDTVIVHLLIESLDGDKHDAGALSTSITTAATLSDAVRSYYRSHRRLHTTTAPAQGNLAGLRHFDFSGRIVIGLIGYDGGRYYGAEFTFRLRSTEDVTPNL